MSPSLVAVVGPTAAGKTRFGLQLAREQSGEIISVDSRQIYRHLSAGTAKPAGAYKDKTYFVEGIPYHLVDFLEPDGVFSAADFAREADALIRQIRKRGRRPILAGGTGFYFKALLEGLAALPPANEAVRENLRAVAKERGRQALHEELRRVDPVAAEAIPPNNAQRVIRALEVFQLTGKPISEWHAEHRKAAGAGRYAVQAIGIDPGKERLDERIAERSRAMLAGGMIEETEALLANGFAADCPALSGLGYPLVVRFLRGEINKDALTAQLILETRQYAKRQRTWFRNQMEVAWLAA